MDIACFDPRHVDQVTVCSGSLDRRAVVISRRHSALADWWPRTDFDHDCKSAVSRSRQVSRPEICLATAAAS